MSDETSETGETSERASAAPRASAKRLRDRVRRAHGARVFRVDADGEEEIDPDEIEEGGRYVVEHGGTRATVATSTRASREVYGAALTSAVTRAFESTAEQQAALIGRLDVRLRDAEEREDKLRARVRELERELEEAREGSDDDELLTTLTELAQVYVERGTRAEIARWINERLLPAAESADERDALAEIAARALNAAPSPTKGLAS